MKNKSLVHFWFQTEWLLSKNCLKQSKSIFLVEYWVTLIKWLSFKFVRKAGRFYFEETSKLQAISTVAVFVKKNLNK